MKFRLSRLNKTTGFGAVFALCGVAVYWYHPSAVDAAAQLVVWGLTMIAGGDRLQKVIVLLVAIAERLQVAEKQGSTVEVKDDVHSGDAPRS